MYANIIQTIDRDIEMTSSQLLFCQASLKSHMKDAKIIEQSLVDRYNLTLSKLTILHQFKAWAEKEDLDGFRSHILKQLIHNAACKNDLDASSKALSMIAINYNMFLEIEIG